MSINMNTKFTFAIMIDDGETAAAKTIEAEGWPEAMNEFLKHAQANGFDIPEKRRAQLLELAQFGRVTL